VILRSKLVSDEDYLNDEYDPDPIYLDEEDEEEEKPQAARSTRRSEGFFRSDDDDEFNFMLDDGSGMEPDNEKKWYVIHCYSGYENKCATRLSSVLKRWGCATKSSM
jgi:hypothetical protein